MRIFTTIVLKLLLPGVFLTFSTLGFSQNYRTYSGLMNNLVHPEWGAAGSNMVMEANYGYADGYSTPAGPDRPNPRVLSNTVFLQNTLSDDPRGLSAYAWGFGQFIDHDVTLVKDHPFETFNIEVPPFDPFFDPTGSGTAVIPMKRSEYDPATGTGPGNPRTHINSISSFIDGSAVYGSHTEQADWLRTFSGGKLKTSAGNMPPFNTTTGEYDAPIDPTAPHMDMPFPFIEKLYVVGDSRGNENPFLLSIHTLFLREHNRICEDLAAEHPDWTDEQLYQRARKLVGGLIEAIVYEEWLPTLGIDVDPYNGYNLEINPGIMNVFSAAAFRYGHTTINSSLLRMDDNGNTIPEGDILLRNAFFNPGATFDIGIEPYLIGMSTVVQQDFDCKVIDDLRNFLFGPPGAGGMDLVALNIQRGRDRGLADYNTLRMEFGMTAVADFSEMTNDPLMNMALDNIYQDIDNIDPWVGFLAENHMPGALFGETAMTIIKKQFTDLRDGDRFYYENDVILTPEEKAWIKGARLADVVRRNCPITCIHDDIFIANPVNTTSVAEAAAANFDFSLYPNPASDFVTVRFDSPLSQSATVRVTDMLGQPVSTSKLEWSAGQNDLSIALQSALPAGMYRVLVTTENGTAQQGFVKL